MSLHLFRLTTLRRVANICDSVKKIENRAERLHTSETFRSHLCQKRAYCEISRATQILRLVPRERKEKSYICPLHFESNVTFTLATRNRLVNVCDRYPKSKSCKLLFRWCHCFRAYHLIPTQWNAKGIVPCKRWNYFAFILNTLHCDAYWRDGVVKFQTQPQKLHTSATICCHLLHKLDYC